MQGAGKAVQGAGDLMFQFAEQRRKQKVSAADAQITLNTQDAQADIDAYFLKNPNDPEGAQQFATERLSKVMDGVDVKGLREDELAGLDQKREITTRKAQIATNSTALKRQISISNATIQQSAESYARAGMNEEASDQVDKMEVPEEQKIALKNKIYSDAVYQAAEMELLEIDTVEGYDAYLDKLQDFDKEKERYKSYEVVVDDTPMGGLQKYQRDHLINLATKQQRRLASSTQKAYDKMVDRAIEGQRYDDLVTPNMKPEELERLDALYQESATGYAKTSPQFLELSDELMTYLTKVEGKKELSMDELNEMSDRIFSDEFNREAKVDLAKLFFQANSHNAMKGEIEYDGKFLSPSSWFNDYEPSDAETKAMSIANQRAQFFFNQKVETPDAQAGKTLNSIGSGLYRVQEAIMHDAKNGLLNDENVDTYIKDVLPARINDFMSSSEQDALDALLLQ